MTDDPQKPLFDISKALRKVQLSRGESVFAELDVRSVDFYTWFEKKKKLGSWTDSADFIRQLVSDRACSTNPEEPLEDGWIELSSDAEVEEFASQLLHQYVGVSPNAGASEVSASERLLEQIKRRIDHHNEQMAAIAKKIESATSNAFPSVRDAFASSAFASSELARVFKMQNETLNLLGSTFADDIAKTIGLTKLGATAEMISKILPPRPKFVIEVSQLRDSISAIGRTNQVSAVAKMLKQIDIPTSLFASEIHRISDSVSIFGRDIHKHLGLTLSPNLGLATISMNKGIASQMENAFSGLQSPLLKNGFLLTADLAFSDQVGRGLASDILKHYADPINDQVSLFRSSRQFVKLDDDDWDLEASVENLEKILTLIQVNQTKDPQLWMAWVTIIGLIISIFSLTIDAKGYLNDVHAEAASKEAEARRAELEAKQQAQSASDKRHFRYLVARTPLRLEPHRQATVIRLVFPDQLLKVFDSNGDWLLVEVYDYSSDQPIKGWLHRKNVRAAP